ncbi:hypothetical protein [Alicyclobacillus fodiniaquatilis]|uniref:AAA domain-containing protein n=1 Tax=Alicyclobacillus fodiniaquatilis TaxID=1661150 RepID=A0ABW4JR74_9BACL
MRDTKLIILDGIPGSGKSTAGPMLADKLTNSNIPNRFYPETEENHPLCIYDRIIGSLESKTEAIWFKNKVEELFRAFVDARSHVAEVTVIESWLFQDHLGAALFRFPRLIIRNEKQEWDRYNQQILEFLQLS